MIWIINNAEGGLFCEYIHHWIIAPYLSNVSSHPEVWYSVVRTAQYSILCLYLFWGFHFWPSFWLVTEQGIPSSRELRRMENRIYELSVTHLICYMVQYSHKIWIYNVISSKHSNTLLPEAHVTKAPVVQKCYYSLYKPQGQEDISVDGVRGALYHVYFLSLSSLRVPSEVNRVFLYSIVSLFLNPHTRGHHIITGNQ